MLTTSTARYAAAFVALSAIAMAWCGTKLALASLVCVAVHELGHYVVVRLCGTRAAVFVSPLIGFVMPRPLGRNGDMTPLGAGIACLAGPVFGMAFGVVAYVAGRLIYGNVMHWPTFLDMIWFLTLAMTVLNLLPFPVLDGGRIWILAAAGNRASARFAASAGFAIGGSLAVIADPIFGVLAGLPSLLVLPAVLEDADRQAVEMDAFVRLILLSGWMLTLAAALGMACLDPRARIALNIWLGSD